MRCSQNLPSRAIVAALAIHPSRHPLEPRWPPRLVPGASVDGAGGQSPVWPSPLRRSTRRSAETFSTVELTADVAATYDNPFDPDQIAVDAEVTTPEGKTLTVPGFHEVPMRLETRGGSERLVPSGSPGFRVRYTPTTAGTHRLVLKAVDRSGAVRSTPLELNGQARPVAGVRADVQAHPALLRVRQRPAVHRDRREPLLVQQPHAAGRLCRVAQGPGRGGGQLGAALARLQ